MICGACGLSWDVDDADPPACNGIVTRAPVSVAVPSITRTLPAELPQYLAARMAAVYITSRKAAPEDRMRDAYRALLDAL